MFVVFVGATQFYQKNWICLQISSLFLSKYGSILNVLSKIALLTWLMLYHGLL
jgi:hypothetical protein